MSFTKYESLRDRVVLITGGASGIGEEFVKAFADNGARVAFFDLNDEAGQALTKTLAASARHTPLFLRCDVTRTDDLKTMIAEARQKLGPASALINNAANDQRQIFTDVTADEFDKTMAVNFRHIYFASQAVVPQMIELGGGSIVNMLSEIAVEPRRSENHSTVVIFSVMPRDIFPRSTCSEVSRPR